MCARPELRAILQLSLLDAVVSHVLLSTWPGPLRSSEVAHLRLLISKERRNKPLFLPGFLWFTGSFGGFETKTSRFELVARETARGSHLDFGANAEPGLE